MQNLDSGIFEILHLLISNDKCFVGKSDLPDTSRVKQNVSRSQNPQNEQFWVVKNFPGV